MSDYKNFLISAMRANVAALTLAKPGIGKTDGVKQLSKALGRPLLILEGAYINDETSLQGIPFQVNGRTRWCPPEHLEIADNAIIFIDDIVLSKAQEMLYALMLDKRIDTRQLPDTVSILAAGNREEDAGVRYAFSPVVANRCAVCMEFEGPTPKEFISWGMDNGISPLVLTAIAYHPELLHRWDSDSMRNPTHRSWGLASRMLQAGGQSVLAALTQTVGAKTAAQCELIIAASDQMVKPESILDGSAKPPADTMVAYITLANLNHVLTAQCTIAQATNAIRFMEDCLQQHHGALTDVAVNAVRRVKGLGHLPAYQEFIKARGKYV